MLVHRRANPSIKFPSIKFPIIHLYTWVDRGTVRVKCLAQEHNTKYPARVRTQTIRPPGLKTKVSFKLWKLHGSCKENDLLKLKRNKLPQLVELNFLHLNYLYHGQAGIQSIQSIPVSMLVPYFEITVLQLSGLQNKLTFISEKKIKI